jgi:hypothetical protein
MLTIVLSLIFKTKNWNWNYNYTYKRLRTKPKAMFMVLFMCGIETNNEIKIYENK